MSDASTDRDGTGQDEFSAGDPGRKPSNGDAKKKNGGARNRKSASDVVERAKSPVRDIILPMVLVIGMFLIVAVVGKVIRLECTSYIALVLTYSLLFGAGGAVLGGALRVQGNLNPFGVPWTVDVAGALGAALLGAAIAFSFKPTCGFTSKLQITDIPLAEPDGNSRVKTFVTVDVDSNLVMQKGHDNQTLNFSFDDDAKFGITIRAYRLENDGYKFLASCKIKFEHAGYVPDLTEASDELVYRLKGGGMPLALNFNAGYFRLLADADRNATIDRDRNLCLQGVFTVDGKKFQPDVPIAPLQIVREKMGGLGPSVGRLSLYFTKQKPSPQTLRQSAQGDAVPANEVLTSPGIGREVEIQRTAPPVAAPRPQPPPAPATERPAAATVALAPAAQPQPQQAIMPPKPNDRVAAIELPLPEPVCFNDDELRTLVDRFLDGDDLDKQTRQQQVYPKWQKANCYVLPIALNVRQKFPPARQARALRLMIYTIINNSEIPGDLTYWQMEGSNRRDFSRRLPFVQEPDLARIFELVPSPDGPVRAEALRFVRTLPVDPFERLFTQKRPQLGSLPAEEQERFAVAANSLYYNRIVEWLDASDEEKRDKPRIARAIAPEFAKGRDWARDAYFNGRSAKPYEATLLYAKGIVEHEIGLTDDSGQPAFKSTFARMLATLKATEDSYPLRPLHIAQALVFTSVPDRAMSDALRKIQPADSLTPSIALDEKSPFAGKDVPMYAAPRKETALSLGASIGVRDGGYLLLRSGDWYLASARNKIGWIMRQ